MSKAVVRVGYTEYVMDMSDAVALIEIMSKAEHLKIRRDYNVSPNVTCYHIWEQDVDHDQITIQLLPNAIYRVAKLAGKPPKD
jgi:hypothetical protein